MEAAMNQGGNHQYGQQNMQPNMQQGFNQNNMGGMQPNPQGFNQNNMGGMQGFNQNNVGGMQPNPQGFNQDIQGGVTPAEPQNIAPAASQADNNSEQ